MQSHLSRRGFVGVAASVVVDQVGCDRVDQAMKTAPTSNLNTAKVALRGYGIVSMTVGARMVSLPHPALRILAVVIMASAAAANLVVEYIDDELILRRIEERLSPEERSSLESAHFVSFKTESGVVEKQYLAPTQYQAA